MQIELHNAGKLRASLTAVTSYVEKSGKNSKVQLGDKIPRLSEQELPFGNSKNENLNG
jgi:hypothetical protein